MKAFYYVEFFFQVIWWWTLFLEIRRHRKRYDCFG